ncbi:MAG: iron-containing redox enzyme family protein, partial [Thermoplasmata archaeon]|nr:iron-containing redox enzyme family protein [Thermoplasmata archaeon]
PRYVAGVYAKEKDPDRRRILLDNLVDEEGGATTHPQLWRQFARALGAPDPGVEPHRQSPGTRALCGTYDRLAVRGGLQGGLGALYAYESIFPAVAHEKARGLQEHYGIQSKSALEFFTVHEQADVAHSAAERQLLEAEMTNATPRRAAEQGARESIGAWWNFLDQFVP